LVRGCKTTGKREGTGKGCSGEVFSFNYSGVLEEKTDMKGSPKPAGFIGPSQQKTPKKHKIQKEKKSCYLNELKRRASAAFKMGLGWRGISNRERSKKPVLRG